MSNTDNLLLAILSPPYKVIIVIIITIKNDIFNRKREKYRKKEKNIEKKR